MSFTVTPAASSAGGIAIAGPIPMMDGSHPTTMLDRSTSFTGSPSSFAFALVIKRQAAAPSDTWELFPAVVLPPFLKAGFNFARDSRVVPSRTPSSWEMTTSFSFPSSSSTMVVTGTISALNRPSLIAAAAFA